MTLSMTEQLAEPATDAIRNAIQKAWIMGYEQAVSDYEAGALRSILGDSK